jgi:hypothetical protein
MGEEHSVILGDATVRIICTCGRKTLDMSWSEFKRKCHHVTEGFISMGLICGQCGGTPSLEVSEYGEQAKSAKTKKRSGRRGDV